MSQLIATDRALTDFDDLMQYISDENIAQLKKWGFQSHSPHFWMTAISEEVGEVAQAVIEHDVGNGKAEHVVKECIQAATLLLKLAEMYDGERGLKRE